MNTDHRIVRILNTYARTYIYIHSYARTHRYLYIYIYIHKRRYKLIKRIHDKVTQFKHKSNTTRSCSPAPLWQNNLDIRGPETRCYKYGHRRRYWLKHVDDAPMTNDRRACLPARAHTHALQAVFNASHKRASSLRNVTFTGGWYRRALFHEILMFPAGGLCSAHR